MNFSTSYIELSQSAVEHNIQFIRKVLSKNAKVASVVKANAYGHGIEAYIPMAEAAGIRYFAVFSSGEAKRVVESRKENSEVMIMGWIAPNELEWAVQEDVSFYIFDLERLQHALEAAKKVGKPARVHLEVETGMHRTGLEQEQFEQAVKFVQKHRQHFLLSGLCTHYAGAESLSNRERVNEQISRFQEARKWLVDEGLRPEKVHSACSAATLHYPETMMDMVRIGVTQYGYWPSPEIYRQYRKEEAILKPILSWKSQVMSLKSIQKGDYVGYHGSFRAQRDTLLGAVPVGYGYGYSRSLSNLGQVLVGTKKAPVVGLVNMNSLMIDVTDIPQVQQGQEVVLIGRQGDEEVKVVSFSVEGNPLNYQLLARLPGDIPRKVVA